MHTPSSSELCGQGRELDLYRVMFDSHVFPSFISILNFTTHFILFIKKIGMESYCTMRACVHAWHDDFFDNTLDKFGE